MVLGAGCESLLRAAGTRCLRRPFVAFEEDDPSLPLIEGHGDWGKALPSMAQVEVAVRAAPWADYRGWLSAMAERVIARSRSGSGAGSAARL